MRKAMCVLCRRGVWSRTAHTALAATHDSALSPSPPAVTLHANGQLVNWRLHQIPEPTPVSQANFAPGTNITPHPHIPNSDTTITPHPHTPHPSTKITPHPHIPNPSTIITPYSHTPHPGTNIITLLPRVFNPISTLQQIERSFVLMYSSIKINMP